MTKTSGRPSIKLLNFTAVILVPPKDYNSLIRFCFKVEKIVIQNSVEIFVMCGWFNLPTSIMLTLTKPLLEIISVIHTLTHLLILSFVLRFFGI